MSKASRGLVLASILVMMVVLVSCGQKAKPPAPNLKLDYKAVKIFEFGWADVKGETGYKLLEDESGSGSFKEVASIPADATDYDFEAFLPGKVNARYKLAACNDAGCSESAAVSVDVGQLVKAVGYFKASNTGMRDRFGYSVALSADGDTLAVGAPYEDSKATGVGGDESDDSMENSGAVYVFARSGSNWSQQAYIKASNTGKDDWFGWRVTLSADGNTLAVGAPYEDGKSTSAGGDGSDNSVYNGGAVYVFARSGSNWSQQAYVKASNTGTGDRFGYSVTLSADGDTLAVGAPFENSKATGVGGDQNDDSIGDSGAVYVFVRSGSYWSQQAYIKASNTGEYDWFGWSVYLSASGDTLAVGAPYEDSKATGVGGDESDDSMENSGAVYVFVRSAAGAWNQQAYIKASNTGISDQFGYSVTLSADGDTLAVGAPYEDGKSTSAGGDGSDNSVYNGGAVYVFARSGSNWSQQAYVKASNTGTGDRFGYSVTLSADGDTLAVGAPFENSKATGVGGDQNDDSIGDSGAVYVFVLSGANWSQQAYVKASNTGKDDWFGRSVALSADGDTLGVGADGEDSKATGVDGDGSDDSVIESGAVYVF